MDFENMKIIIEESANVFSVLIPPLFFLAAGIMAIFEENLRKMIINPDNITIKVNKFSYFAIAIFGMLIFFSPRLEPDKIAKVTIPVTMTDTKYTDKAKELLKRDYEYNKSNMSMYEGFVEIDDKGKPTFHIKLDGKEVDEMRKDGTLNEYLQNTYKGTLKWAVGRAIEKERLENAEQGSGYVGNELTKEEEMKAIEMYKKWKEYENNPSNSEDGIKAESSMTQSSDSSSNEDNHQ